MPDGEEKQQLSPIEQIKKLLGIDTEPEMPSPQVISNIDVEKLLKYIIEDTPQYISEMDIHDAEQVLHDTTILARKIVDPFTKDGISRIIHVPYGSGIVTARLITISIILSKMIENKWIRVARMIEQNAPPDEVARQAYEAERFEEAMKIVLPEVYARLLTLYYINAPPGARPALADAALGYQVLGRIENMRR